MTYFLIDMSSNYSLGSNYSKQMICIRIIWGLATHYNVYGPEAKSRGVC